MLFFVFSTTKQIAWAYSGWENPLDRQTNGPANLYSRIENLFVLDRLFDKENNGLLNNETTSLGDIFILDQLFYKNEPLANNTPMTLGDLFVLDRLFSSPENQILDQNRTSLGDVLILNQLFTGGKPIILGKYFNNPQLTIGDLLVLNKLFSQDLDFVSDGTILGNLLILDKIFRQPQNLMIY